MLGLYTGRDVQKLVRRLREEYDAVLEKQKEVVADLKEQNRNLLARVSKLETERSSVSDAIVYAVAEGERIKRESSMEAENERKELVLLAEKCRSLTEKLSEEQPDAGSEAEYSEFLQKLQGAIGQPPETQSEVPPEAARDCLPEAALSEARAAASEAECTDSFNMEDVLAPKEPLNLEKLCIDLGLMEEDSE